MKKLNCEVKVTRLLHSLVVKGYEDEVYAKHLLNSQVPVQKGNLFNFKGF